MAVSRPQVAAYRRQVDSKLAIPHLPHVLTTTPDEDAVDVIVVAVGLAPTAQGEAR